jgi:hypothetical protein
VGGIIADVATLGAALLLVGLNIAAIGIYTNAIAKANRICHQGY